MKQIARRIGLGVLCMLAMMTTNASESQSLQGSWEGKLKAGIQEFPLIFHVKDVNGKLTATLDSPAQGATGIPVSHVTLEHGEIRLEITAAQAVYEGTVSDSNTTLEGVWRQGPNELPLVLEKRVNAQPQTALVRPQTPKKPYEYTEEFVSFYNEKANIQLAGTLTLPSEGARVPAVVMITGSGPQDRDQTFMGHKTFWVLADYFTRKGIAVLRFDDRGIAESEGNFAQATSLDFADDANAAVNFLLSHDRIDPKAIGLIGHSEGGLIAPIAASQNEHVSFIVSLAGPGLKGNEIAVKQMYDSLVSAGLAESSATAGSQITQALNKTVMQNQDISQLPDSLRKTYERVWDSLSDTARRDLRSIGGGELSQARIAQLSSPWTKYFLQHDPRDYLSKLDIPVMALHGENDTQLDVMTNLGIFENELRGRNSHNHIERFESLNHLFQPSETGLINEYVSIETTFSPEVMDTISHWVLRVSRQ